VNGIYFFQDRSNGDGDEILHLITTANFHQTAKHPVPKALSMGAVILKTF
jgi:hypothetical protein